MTKYFTFSNVLFCVCLLVTTTLALIIGNINVWIIWCSTILGILASKHASQGSWLTFLFDILSYVFYINVCQVQKNYGEMFLSYIIILTHTFGIIEWKNHQKNNVVSINKIKNNEFNFALFVAIFMIIIYSFFLHKIGSNLIFLNAFSTIIFLLGNYFSYRRSVLQFYFWNLYEISYILIWLLGAIRGNIEGVLFLFGATVSFHNFDINF